MTRVGEMMLFTALWLLCCLPVVTVGAATAALYRMAFNMRQEGTTKITDFFRAFAQNFKKATLLWLAVILAAAVLMGLYFATALVGSDIVRVLLLLVFCVGFIVCYAASIYVFPLTAYFENTVAGTLRNAVGMGMGHLRSTVPACALSLIPWIVAVALPEFFLGMLFLWVFLAPGALAYAITGPLQKVFKIYEAPREDKNKDLS